MSDRWEELYVEVTAAEADRIEAERRAKLASQSRAELFRWSRKACREVLSSATKIAKTRAADLKTRAGIEVEVSGPDWSALRDGKDSDEFPSAEVGSLHLRCRDSEIVLYTHTTPGRLPTLHFLVRTQRSWPHPERNPRLVTIPGCRFAQGEDGSTRLRIVDRRGVSSVAANLDDIVFRGFELLLRRGPFPWAERFPMVDPGTDGRSSTPILGSNFSRSPDSG